MIKKMMMIVCLSTTTWAFETPVSLFALLKTVYSASLFSVYAPEVGYLYCALYGVQAPIYTQPDMMCQIDIQRATEMRYHAKNFTQRTLFLEQKYRLGYADGYCIVQDGSNVFNATIIKEGYAVARPLPKIKGDSALKADLELLESIARKDKKGLWGDYEKEMKCLKQVGKDRPAGIEQGY